MTLRKIKAFLVEDDAIARRMMEAALTTCNLEVFSFDNAEEAWSACQEKNFDIGLVDWMLPGMDGLELCRRIRSLSWGDQAVLIVVTSHDRPEALTDVLAAGVDDYITKPIDMGTLCVRVQIAQQMLANLDRRKRAEACLCEARDEMEEMVAQRTATLQQALMNLKTEIEERRMVEDERARLVTAIEQIDESIIVTDSQGVILHVNPAFERNTGFSADHAVGSTPRILKSDKHDSKFYKELWLTIKAGAVWKGHLINRRADGSLCEVDATISPVRDDSGSVVNFVAVSRDVTETLALERQLRQAHRMEALGRFASEIAHDFTNLISVAQTTVDQIRERMPAGDPIQEDLEVIRRTTAAGKELTRALITFGQDRVVEPQTLDLDEVVDTFMPVLRRLIPPAIVLNFEPTEERTTFLADRSQVEQLILNLCANARDAMPDGGSLTLCTRAMPVSDGTGPGSVAVTVTDTGLGMDEETLAHIFEPFFSTKKQGQGSGLGLATVYNIVTQAGGAVTVTSNQGQGSTFTVSFPSVEPRTEEVETPESPQETSNSGRETLLVVEDHAALRLAMSKFLSGRGYRVLNVTDGDLALEVLKEERDPIDLVITDLNLPKMGGLELFKRSQEGHRRIRFLFCSGFLPGLLEAADLSHGSTSCMEKPFELEDMCRQVRELLDRDLEN